MVRRGWPSGAGACRPLAISEVVPAEHSTAYNIVDDCTTALPLGKSCLVQWSWSARGDGQSNYHVAIHHNALGGVTVA